MTTERTWNGYRFRTAALDAVARTNELTPAEVRRAIPRLAPRFDQNQDRYLNQSELDGIAAWLNGPSGGARPHPELTALWDDMELSGVSAVEEGAQIHDVGAFYGSEPRLREELFRHLAHRPGDGRSVAASFTTAPSCVQTALENHGDALRRRCTSAASQEAKQKGSTRDEAALATKLHQNYTARLHNLRLLRLNSANGPHTVAWMCDVEVRPQQGVRGPSYRQTVAFHHDRGHLNFLGETPLHHL